MRMAKHKKKRPCFKKILANEIFVYFCIQVFNCPTKEKSVGNV